MEEPTTTSLATFGGGCFWCVEAMLKTVKGVQKVTSGYSGGHKVNPTYKEVKSHSTGHAEVVQIEYNPKEVTYQTLLKAFFSSHDPTTVNKQGKAVGPQYRSIILYHNESQKTEAEAMVEYLNTHEYEGKVVTEVVEFKKFYSAEDYHQDFYVKNPERSGRLVPKMEKFNKKFRPEEKSEKEDSSTKVEE